MINTKEKYKKLYNEADDTTKAAADMLSEYSGYIYICDAISERADSNVDIYNGDLIEWAKSHICEIDEAADELGKPDSFIGYIQQAQFLANEPQNGETGRESGLRINNKRKDSKNEIRLF